MNEPTSGLASEGVRTSVPAPMGSQAYSDSKAYVETMPSLCWPPSMEPEPLRRIAILDIGSNTVRLVVFRGATRVPQVIFTEKLICGLGRELGVTGRMSAAAMQQALTGIDRYIAIARIIGVSEIQALATAAVRDASNGPALVEAIFKRTGLYTQVIDGVEEARLSSLGVLSGFPDADGLVGDLGGGSLELMDIGRPDQRKMGQRVSLPLGPMRLLARLGTEDSAVRKAIDQTLAAIDWLGEHADRGLYIVGGTWRAIAKLHMAQTGYPLHVLQGYEMSSDAVLDFCERIWRNGSAALKNVEGINRRRIELMPHAALVLARLMTVLRPRSVHFSAQGLREGWLYDQLPPVIQKQDPLLATCRDFAFGVGRYPPDAGVLERWMAPLFLGESSEQRRLRRAAALLADISWPEHPDYQAKHAYWRILRMPALGISHAGRAFLALAIQTRYTGKTTFPDTPENRALLPKIPQRRAILVGLALRLAYSLAGGAINMLDRIRLELTDLHLTLAFPADDVALLSDPVKRRLDDLARLLNRPANIRILPGSMER